MPGGRPSSSAPRSTATARGTAVRELAERHYAPRSSSRRCAGVPVSRTDHRLFAGFLPAMRERIVALLDGYDTVFAIGAAAFTYHVEGSGPYVPPGANCCS